MSSNDAKKMIKKLPSEIEKKILGNLDTSYDMYHFEYVKISATLTEDEVEEVEEGDLKCNFYSRYIKIFHDKEDYKRCLKEEYDVDWLIGEELNLMEEFGILYKGSRIYDGYFDDKRCIINIKKAKCLYMSTLSFGRRNVLLTNMTLTKI